MIIGHVLPDKETSLVEAYEKCRGLADPKVCCDYALHVGITWWAPKVTGEGPKRREHALLGRGGAWWEAAGGWDTPATTLITPPNAKSFLRRLSSVSQEWRAQSVLSNSKVRAAILGCGHFMHLEF